MQSSTLNNWKMSFAVSCVLVLLVSTSAGLAPAQTVDTPPHAVRVQGPDRSGFTLLLTMGVGFQKFDSGSGTETGLAGLNLGIGGFLSPDMALMFRVSGTNVQRRSVDIISGFGGPALQYWTSDSLNLEAGLGLGFASNNYGYSSRGYGMLLGMGWSLYHKDQTSLQLGFEYAPVFLDGSTIHNIGLTFGWQLL